MAVTRAEAEKIILEYLEANSTRKSAWEQFTYSEIQKLIPESPEIVDQALDALRRDGVIESHGVNVRVYLPRSSAGKKVRASLARSSLVSYSPFGAILLALILLYIGVYYSPAPSPPSQPVVPDLYQEGILSGIVYSALAALVLGYIIRESAIRIRKWQLVSEATYAFVSRVAIYSIVLIGLCLGAYYAGSGPLHYGLEQTVMIAIVAIIVTGAVGAMTLISRPASEG